MLEILDTTVPQTRGMQIYTQLRWKLLVGGVLPGEQLTVRQVAGASEVSFTPAREALTRLANEGALVLGPRFFSVPHLTRDEATEIYRARRLLEGELSAAALPNLAQPDLAALQRSQDAMVAALAARRFDEALEANHAFHFGIYAAAGMPVFLRMVEALWVRCGPSLNHMYPRLNLEPGHVHGHVPILDALERRDRRAFRQALENDLVHGLRSILAAQDERPGGS